MAKFLILLSVVLVISVAFAYDPEAEEADNGALAVKNCVTSINRIFSEVARKYSDAVKFIKDEATRNEAFKYYNDAAQVFNALNAQVRNAKERIRMTFVLKSFGGNSILCSDDVAREVYGAFYNAFDGLDKLAKSSGQQ